MDAQKIGSDQHEPEKQPVPPVPPTDRVMQKRQTILQACEEHNIDSLIQLADSPGGLLEDELRRKAWPLLLHCDGDQGRSGASTKSWEALPPHRDEEQVQRDVDRAFVYYPNSDSQEVISNNKAKLFNLIARVLRTHQILCYFQGYHDILQVLLLVLGEDDAFPAVARLSLCRIRDYMLPSLTPAIKHLRLIPGILQLADAALAQHLSHTEPFFALSATLTLYAHDIQEYSDIARLYDFILAHEPVVSIYLFASIILRRRKELMAIPIEEPEMIHFTLSKLPQPLDLEALISSSLTLFQQYPPEKLPQGVWRKLSSYSVLKTARYVNNAQELGEAERLFHYQEKQLAREESVKKSLIYIAKNRRPIASIGTALFIGTLAVWLQRSGHDRTLLAGFWQVVNLVWKR